MPTNLKALTEGIHSKEALEMVREHLLGVMGPTAQNQFSNAMLKMSKFQMAQVGACVAVEVEVEGGRECVVSVLRGPAVFAIHGYTN